MLKRYTNFRSQFSMHDKKKRQTRLLSIKRPYFFHSQVLQNLIKLLFSFLKKRWHPVPARILPIAVVLQAQLGCFH